MTKDEVVSLLADIIAAFPSFRVEDKTRTIKMYAKSLQPYKYEDIDKALTVYIRESGSQYAPALPELIKRAKLIGWGWVDEDENLTERLMEKQSRFPEEESSEEL